MTIFHLAALGLPLLATFAVAKTDIEGCTSFTSTVTPWPGQRDTYETVLYYVPDTLEICQGVDCGGGRAPPRNVPGCPIYKGTETVKTMYLTVDPMAPVKTVETTATATATATETKSTDSISTAVAPPPTSASSTSAISAPAVTSSNTSSAETSISSHISSTDGHSVSSHPSITETIHSTVSVSDSAAQPTAVFPAAMKVVAGVVAGVVLL